MEKRLPKIAFVLLPLFLVFSKAIYAKSQIDSLQAIWENETEIDSNRFQALSDYSSIYGGVFPDAVLGALDYHYDLAFRKKADREMFRALLRKGNIYSYKGQFKEAGLNYKQANLVAKKMGNVRLEAIVTGNIGNIYFNQQEHLEAIQYYNEAKAIFVKEGDFEGVARILMSIGNINSSIGNYDIALKYYQKCLALSQKANPDIQDDEILQMNIGLIYLKKELFYDAREVFEKALKIAQENKNNFLISDCYGMLAEINFELNQMDAAYAFARKNLNLTQELDIQSKITDARITFLQIDYSKNKDQSILEMEKILNKSPENRSFEQKKEIYEFLYIGYKHQKKWDLSLEMYELQTAYNDSIQNRINGFAVARETIKNEYEKKLFDVKLQAEKEKAQIKITQAKKVILTILSSLLLISLIGYYSFSRNKKNKKRKDQLLNEIKLLKTRNLDSILGSQAFKLSKEKIDTHLNRVLNKTDWNVLLILLDNPVAMNKEIADRAFMSIDGIGSS